MKSVQLYHSSALRATVALLAVVAMFTAVAPASTQNNDAHSLIRLRTRLHGQVFNGEKPHGKAEFEKEDGGKKFSAEVEDIALTDGSVVNVLVDGHKVGTITLQLGAGNLLLTGKNAPSINVGSRVSIRMPGGQRILTGVF